MPQIQPEWWGWFSLIVAACGYVPYFVGMYMGTTKPHAFSWIVWSLLAAIAFSGQREAGAGSGAWINQLIAVVCFVIASIAVIKIKQSIILSDWTAFIAAVLIIPLWRFTQNPLLALLAVTAIDTLGFFPTFRKSWDKPNEEKLITYASSMIQYLASVLAMDSINWTTTFYPSWMACMNCFFIVMVLWRRKRMREAP
jgi:hypothetical protein